MFNNHHLCSKSSHALNSSTQLINCALKYMYGILRKNKIKTLLGEVVVVKLNWPMQSPDLNPMWHRGNSK